MDGTPTDIQGDASEGSFLHGAIVALLPSVLLWAALIALVVRAVKAL